MTISEHTVDAVAQLLADRIGLATDASTRGRLAQCVTEAAHEAGLAPDAFAARLRVDRRALQRLLDSVTVQESGFFRDPVQFDAFARHLLPELRDPVTVWSAGCGNGQEPYSVAITLAEAQRRAWRVIATDVSAAALERAEAGVYSQKELRGLSGARRAAHFRRTGEDYVIAGSLRRQVEFRHHNLTREPPPFAPAGSTVVFCRNVLIYFRPDDVVAFLDRLAAWMPREAVLFLGYSESLWHVSDRFTLRRLGNAFVYQLPSATPEPAAAEAADGLARRRVRSQMREGEMALAAGDTARAAAVFAEVLVAEPRNVVAQLQLGLALERTQDRAGARRAFAAGRRTLTSMPAQEVEAALEGFAASELLALFDEKLGRR